MLSYSEYKLREVNEPPSEGATAMPDPVSGMPPGESGPPSGIGGPPNQSASLGGIGDMGSPPADMGGMGGMGGVGDQKPTPLVLKASNFWDVLESMLKKSKKETKKLN